MKGGIRMNKTLHRFEPDYAVPPGETLKETMQFLGMSQKELAARAGLTVQTLNRIFSGEQVISYETANRLELVTGTPAQFWNNLEAQYREQITKIKEKERFTSDLKWLKTIPFKELCERGYVEQHQDRTVVLRNTLKFYGVSSISAWNDIWEKPAVAARRSKCFETQPGSASAWIRIGELKAQQIDCKTYNKPLFKKVLGKIRSLTQERTQVFEPQLKKLCAEAGIAISLVREMKKVPWNGATKWLSPQKAMILLSLRGKGEDRFWFSFFHEAGHILYDNKKDVLINDGSHEDQREVRADKFAAGFLIPPQYNPSIANLNTKASIKRFATDIGVSPGIVVGRYHYLTKKWNYFNDLVRKFEWA